jgi:hypothetical protein
VESRLLGVSTVVSVLNMAVFVATVLHVVASYESVHDGVENYLVPQDIWAPLLFYVGLQCLANGVVMTLRKRSRALGVGILIGWSIAFVALLVFVFAFLAPALAD